MNSALINGMLPPPRLEMGSISSSAPTRIIPAKPSAIICAGESFMPFLCPRVPGLLMLMKHHTPLSDEI